ncbi:hypothetical protein NPIL_488411 [Nephila pilipes]|uniref:Uncharacterized protein n=1 Tax=Nephila pilipes TaxID=299642 RepID=A0A8X6P333_NEPPI|nr:hypothetical protein NPIL_488411 [Nephila pilipes]
MWQVSERRPPHNLLRNMRFNQRENELLALKRNQSEEAQIITVMIKVRLDNPEQGCREIGVATLRTNVRFDSQAQGQREI